VYVERWKNFFGEKFGFSVCVLRSVLVSEWCLELCLLVFCGALLHGLWCASMLVSVTFGMLLVLAALREEKFQKKKETIPFSLLLPRSGCTC